MTVVTLHAPFAGWLRPIDEVPDRVFADRMMGDGLAIDPVEGVLRAPADAVVVGVPESAHAITLRVANGAELLIHVGLETVALAGHGFTALVTPGASVARGDALIAFDLDRIARAVSDMVTPIVLTSEGASVVVAGDPRLVAAGEVVAQVTAGPSTGQAATGVVTARRTLVVEAPHGLHARPAARIVALLRSFDAQVDLTLGGRRASGRSTVALLALGATHGAEIEATASGTDAEAALAVLADFAAARFGDGEVVAPPAPPTRQAGPVTAAPGLAIGRVRQFRLAALSVPEAGRGVATETAALDEATRTVAASLGSGDIAEAHRAILDDPTLRDAALAGIAAGQGAGFAWRAATRGAAAALRSTGDARLMERVADLDDIERQLLTALTGEAPAMPDLAPDTILVAEDLLPSQFLALDRGRLAGICTAAGGATAHVAILAAAAGIPMVVAAGRGVLAVPDDTPAILDADAASLAVDPHADTLAAARATLATRRETRVAQQREAQAPCHTADGRRIEVFANLGSDEDAADAVRAGAEGCGLLRTEFLFLDRDTAPSEEEQRAAYAAIAATLGDRPLIVRTLDIGGDKAVAYLPHPAEENPALGLRGVRLMLARPDMLATQLRAILRGVPGRQCRIMLPMIVDTGEIAAVRTALDAAMAATGRSDPVELGVMVETPAAALLADSLARHVDFLSVGTNDLTQYALAADRGNPEVAAMVDAFHPAVLRLIRQAADGARRHDRWIGVCGGLASDPRAAALLIGLGITELSVVPAAVPAVKASVRGVTMATATVLADRALAATSPAEVRALLAEGVGEGA